MASKYEGLVLRPKSLDKLNEIKNRINIKDLWFWLNPSWVCKYCGEPTLMKNEVSGIKCMNCHKRYKE